MTNLRLVSYGRPTCKQKEAVARDGLMDHDDEMEFSARQRLVLLTGSIGPLGHVPASGTVTVFVLGPPLFYILSGQHWFIRLAVVATVTGLAIWIHDVGDRILNQKDSRKLVWDEIAGYMVAVAFLPFTWKIALLAAVVERFIDILKVPPANKIERVWPGGWGVVGDDIVAGLYAYAVMWIVIRLMPWFAGVGP